MRPRRLIMQAFGPYAEREVVDFDRITGTLLLVHGRTGAGKTTILDAMCFALFGKSMSDADREGVQLRSQFALPDTLTEVTFDFDLGQDRYRVRRSPTQLRPKRRGRGTTEHKASATLWKLEAPNGENETVLATTTGAVDGEIHTRVGFTVKQFRQVVLLPQGRFRDVLTAKSSDREKIFATLFETDRFKRLETELVRRAGEQEREVERASTRRQDFLDELGVEDRDEIVGEEKTTQTAAREAEKIRRAAGEKAKATREARAAAEVVERLHHEVVAARQEMATIKGEAQEVVDLEQRWDAHRRATSVVSLVAAYESACERRREADGAVRQSVREMQAVVRDDNKTSQVLAAEEHPDREEDRRIARRTETKLERAASRLEPWREAKARCDETKRNVTKTAKALDLARQKRAAAQARRAETALEFESVDIIARDVAPRELEVRRLEAHAKHLTQVQERQAAVDIATNDLTRATETIDKARQHRDEARLRLHDAEAARRDEHAAALAASLEDDHPCPVCGSVEHPAPALRDHEQAADQEHDAPTTTKATFPSIDELLRDVERLDREYDQFGVNVRDAQRRLDRAVARLEAIDEESNPELPTRPNQLTERRAQARERFESARTASTDATRLKQTLVHHDRDIVRLDTAVALADDAARAAASDDVRARTVLDERAAEFTDLAPAEIPTKLETARRHRETLETAREVARTAAEKTARTRAAAEAGNETRQAALAERQAELDTAADAMNEALAAVNFADFEKWHAARLDAGAARQIEDRLREHRERVIAARTRFERAEATLDDRPRPDIAALRDAEAKSEASEKQAIETLVTARERAAAIVRRRRRFDEIDNERRAGEARYATIGRLADAARGRNARQTTFHEYVLAHFLDRALQLASRRLESMTAGRFELEREEVPKDKRSNHGLDLRVHDHHTGRKRPVATLSGGESFMAALAMALGLSDLVERRAGGLHLDTLFIDEGFGSLDEDSLDRAVDVLIGLGRTKRLVGIISHVPELRERIDTRLEVISNRGRARTRIVE